GDHAPVAALEHARQERVGKGYERLAVDPYLLGLPRWIDLAEAPVRAKACVVHQHVHLQTEPGHLLRECRCFGGQVTDDDVAAAVELRAQLLQAIRAPSHEDNLVAAGGELLCELRADPRGCACHERHFGHARTLTDAGGRLRSPVPRGALISACRAVICPAEHGVDATPSETDRGSRG